MKPFHDARCDLGEDKTQPMLRFCLGYLRETPGRLLRALPCALPWVALRLLASFPSLPPIVQSKYSFCTLNFVSDLLTGAWEVDCGLVAMVTSLMLLLPALQHPPYPLRIGRSFFFFFELVRPFATFRPNDDRVRSWRWNNFTNNNSWRVLTWSVNSSFLFGFLRPQHCRVALRAESFLILFVSGVLIT